MLLSSFIFFIFTLKIYLRIVPFARFILSIGIIVAQRLNCDSFLIFVASRMFLEELEKKF